MEKDEQSGMRPEQIARFVCKIANKKRIKLLYTVGLQYKLIVFLVNILPHKFSNKLIGRLYAK